MKKNAMIRIWIWTFVAFVLLTTMVLGMGGIVSFATNTNGRNSTGTAYSDGGVSIPAGNIREIDVNWVSGEMDIRFYDGADIQITETADRALNDNQRLRYEVKGDKLIIDFSGKNIGLFVNTPSKSLELLIPAGIALDKLSVENVSSGVTLTGKNTQLNELDIDNVSGTVFVADVHARKLDMETVSGSVEFTGTYAEIDAESVSGKQVYRLASLPGKMDADSVSGAIVIYTNGHDGFVANLDTVSGKITSDFAEVPNKHTAMFGNNGARLEFETVSGSVSIQQDGNLQAPAVQAEDSAAKPDKPAKETVAPGTSPIPGSNRTF